MRRTLAGLIAGAALVVVVGSTGSDYVTTCPTASEDSFPITCQLDPSGRYDYDHGAWRLVDDSTRYANGNRPPTGAEIMAMGPDGP